MHECPSCGDRLQSVGDKRVCPSCKALFDASGDRLNKLISDLGHLEFDGDRAATIRGLLKDVFFGQAVCRFGAPEQLVDLYEGAADHVSTPREDARNFRLVGKAVARHLQFLRRRPDHFFQQMYNTCWWHDAPEADRHYDSTGGRASDSNDSQDRGDLRDWMERWRAAFDAETGAPWIRHHRPPPNPLASPLRTTLRGHFSNIGALAMSADGRRVVSGDEDGDLRIWNAQTGRELGHIDAHDVTVADVAISEDGAFVAAAAHDNTASVWEVDGGRESHRLEAHSKRVSSVAFGPEGRLLVTGSADESVRVWDLDSGRTLSRMADRLGRIAAVACAPDGQRVAAGDRAGRVRVWDVDRDPWIFSGGRVVGPDEESPPVDDIAFDPAGERLAAGAEDETVRVWDLDSGREIAHLDDHEKLITSVAFTPDGAHVVSASELDSIRVWEVDGGREVACLKAHTGMGTHITVGGDFFASGGADKMVRIWNFEWDWKGVELKGCPKPAGSVDADPDGRYLAASSMADLPDYTICVWEFDSGVETFRMDECFTSFPLALSPDGNYLAVGTELETLSVFEVETGREIHRLTGHSDTIVSVAFGPDGDRLVSGGFDKTARVWDLTDGEELVRLEGHTHFIQAVAFGPNGRRIASGSTDETARVWHVEEGREVTRFDDFSDQINGVAFGPAGDTLATVGFREGDVRLWSLDNEEEIVRFRGDDYGDNVLVGSDGDHVASYNDLTVWNAATDELVGRIEGPTDPRAVLEGEAGRREPLVPVSEDVETTVYRGTLAEKQPVCHLPGQFSPELFSSKTPRVFSGLVAGRFPRPFTVEGNIDEVENRTEQPGETDAASGHSSEASSDDEADEPERSTARTRDPSGRADLSPGWWMFAAFLVLVVVVLFVL